MKDKLSKAWTYLSKSKRVVDKKYGDCFTAELVYDALKIASNQETPPENKEAINQAYLQGYKDGYGLAYDKFYIQNK